MAEAVKVTKKKGPRKITHDQVKKAFDVLVEACVPESQWYLSEDGGKYRIGILKDGELTFVNAGIGAADFVKCCNFASAVVAELEHNEPE